MGIQGMGIQGMGIQGMGIQGMGIQGMGIQGMGIQGMGIQGMGIQSTSIQAMRLRGIDRLRTTLSLVEFRGVSLADLDSHNLNLQGLQTGTLSFDPIAGPMTGVQLQRGPTDTNTGSYIFVPSLPATTSALKGTFWNIVLAEACTVNADCPGSATCNDGVCINVCTNDSQCQAPGAQCIQGSCSDVEAAVPLYISDVEVDHQLNTSKYPANDDIYLYTVYYRHPATNQWMSLCPLDIYGKTHAMAVPLNATDHSDAGRSKFTFACTASGVAAKCARNWGYKPWKTVTENVRNGTASVQTDIPLAPFYDACLIAARADYCQDDRSYTKNGTLVDLFDTVDGVTSINPTSGLPFEPNSSGVMLHEEYEVSALDVATSGLATPEPFFVGDDPSLLMSLSDRPDQQQLVKTLRRSGMQTSRYAELDPGRTCAAYPYIDQCDPTEPYSCYRATNLAKQSYGGFIAVNSPRHCSHDELTDGEALDPLCNACVQRICEIDPTCCGDPGNSYYPGTLVWDSRCSALHDTVCLSSPGGTPWTPGEVAPVAGSHPAVFLHGAIGSFEGIVCQGGTGAACTGGAQYAEGWACDPDHPGASIPVQISVGDQLGGSPGCGAPGAAPCPTLYTTIADQVLVSQWNEDVSAECGGGARHGFRFQLPAVAAGQPVYAYGIDTDVPGAPFSLLRGGAKASLGGTIPAPRAAIWTGWVEPTVTGTYTFCRESTPGSLACAPTNAVNPSGADLFRVWVNGVYVDGNWQDTDPTVPGAFMLAPPASTSSDPRPTLSLRRGLRYGLRVEYLRPSSTASGSALTLLWSQPGAMAFSKVPSTALYPIAQPDGQGLLGTYYPNSVGNPGDPASPTTTLGAVDYVWNDSSPPVVGRAPVGQPPSQPLAGLSVNDTFHAVFDGQVVPPISGDYTFTTDSDGPVKIYVNGQLVTNRGLAPPINDPATCTHDVCKPGAALSRTCREGYFCAAQICLNDPSCCAQTWDTHCVQEVTSICHFDCAPLQPQPISLLAGQKVDIQVQYQHFGGVPGETPVRGAALHLQWAVAGALPDTIPKERLFYDGSAAGLGVGINAAYFADPDSNGVATEYLDHVESQLVFAAVPPDATLAHSLICVSNTCGGVAPSAPALVGATNTAASGGQVAVTISGSGAEDQATVEIWSGSTASGSWVPSVQIATVSVGATASATTGGTFTAAVTVGKGSYEVASRQTIGGMSSAWSEVLAFTAADPAAPPPPTVNVPTGGLVSGNGTVTLSGTAAPNATVTIKNGGTTLATTTAAANGNWSTSATVPTAGGYGLTVTQTVGGIESTTGALASLKVPLPPLAVSQPHDGDSVGASIVVEGSGAASSLGPVHIADGDGTFFGDLALVSPDVTGAFTSPSLSLDYGQHKLKVYQQANGLAGDGVRLTVTVPPPAVTITSPTANQIVDASFTVTGQGLKRTALPGTALVTVGGIGPFEAQLRDQPGQNYTTFTVPIAFSNGQVVAGAVSLSVKQTASSLAGGGSAPGPEAAFPIHIRPPAPAITSPAAGSAQAATVDVSGNAPGAVSVIISGGGTQQPATGAVGPSGSFTVTGVELVTGTHQLSAVAVASDGTQSYPSATVLVSSGDITPPPILTSDITVTTASIAGTTVDFSSNVTAQDCNGVPAVCVSLTATCVPASNSTFPLGSTTVTCSATDDAGNRGTTTLVVNVEPAYSTDPTMLPDVEAADLTVAAPGPDGANVDYQVTAEGFIADCSTPGSGEIVPCTQWNPAYKGLGFTPTFVAIDPNDPTITTSDGKRHGALYAGYYNLDGNQDDIQLLRSTDAGATWQPLTSPGFGHPVQVVVGPSQPASSSSPAMPASLYVPGTLPGTFNFGGNTVSFTGGIKISRDAGSSWTTAVEQNYVQFLTSDSSNPLHMLAVGQPGFGTGSWEIFETHDAWATWNAVSMEGLPGQQILAVAIDPLNPDRFYASIAPPSTDTIQVVLFRKVGATPWQRLDVPPYPAVLHGNATAIAVAPALLGHAFPPVLAGQVVSFNGGDSWQPALSGQAQDIIFDHQIPSTVWATGFASLSRSNDGGATWVSTNSSGNQPVHTSIVQDMADPQTLYATYPNLGLYKSTDGGTSWKAVLAPGIALPDVTVLDLAFDPVEAGQIYLLTENNLFQTSDGAGSWTPVGGVGTGAFTFSAQSRLAVDQTKRNNIYMGGVEGLWKSPDSGANWVVLADSASQGAEFLGLDSRTTDKAYLSGFGGVVQFQGGWGDPTCSSGPCGNEFDAEQVTNAVSRPVQVWLPDQLPLRGQVLTSIKLQTIPDAYGSVLMTFQQNDPAPSPSPRSVLLWDPNLLPAPPFSTPPNDPFADDLVGVDAFIPSTHLVYDGSAGRHDVFVGGTSGQAVPAGRGDTLYRTTIEAIRSGGASWTQLNHPAAMSFPDSSQGPFTDFTRLAIDPVAGGQVMYTIGAGNSSAANQDTLWESDDGGKTWRPDARTPQHLTNFWVSPVDGAIYGTVSASAFGTFDTDGTLQQFATSWPGVLWKRTPATKPPSGARIFRSSLRPTCTGGDGTQSVGPGAKFPLGTTQVTCSATDVFGHTGSRTFNINVAYQTPDTTPPSIFVPADIALDATDPTGRVVTFNVSATDTVSGPITAPALSCVPSSGNTFPVGTTVVTCSAIDQQGNRATKTFNVTINGLPPTLTLADNTFEATDLLGAMVTYSPTPSAVDAIHHDALTPICIPDAVSTPVWFPLGDTPVPCTATDTSGRTTSGIFTVHVVDTTKPVVSVPPTQTFEASGPDGAPTNLTLTGAALQLQLAGTAQSAPATISAFDAVTPQVVPVCQTWRTAGQTTAITPGLVKFALGTTHVTCSATDAAGNTGAASFDVVVRDTTPPSLSLPGPLTVDADATGTGSALVSFIATASDAVSGSVSALCTPDSGSRFPAGTTTVSCSARDAAGNETDGAFVVTVNFTKTANGDSCASSAACASGFCSDGVCCDRDCGNDANDCQACSVAAGATANGTCATLPTTHTCRVSAGLCDLPETCDGTHNACPADQLAPSTTVCRPSTGSCDAPETCSGSSKACPADTVAPAGTVCAQPTNRCQSAGICSGSTGTCPGPVAIPGCGIFSGVPSTIVAYTASTSGTNVTYTPPTAADGLGGTIPVSCLPASGSLFAVGTKTVTCTASGVPTPATFTVWVQYQVPADGSFFLQPINPDGSSIFKQGSTVPVKFKLLGASAGVTNLVAHVFVGKVSNSVTGTYVEAVSTANSDAGNTFRYDASGPQYIFNLSTKSMSPGTWSVRADLGDGVNHSVGISLR
jgi:hypothetical protein